MRVSVWVRRETVERGSPQRLEISRLPSRASWPSKHLSTSKARETTWMTSPSRAASPESSLGLLNRSERRPMASPISVKRNKIPLTEQATSRHVRPQQEVDWHARYQDRYGPRGVPAPCP